MSAGTNGLQRQSRRAFLNTLSVSLSARYLAGVFGGSDLSAGKVALTSLRHGQSAKEDETSPWLHFDMPNLRRIVIKGQINGVSANILLDSGVGTFVLHDAFAARLGLREIGGLTAIGMTNFIQGDIRSGVRVELGNFMLPVIKCSSFDLSTISGAIYHPVDAILGRDIFDACQVDLDFGRTRVRFLRGGIPPSIPNATEVPLKPVAFGMRALSICIEDRPPIDAILDLGADRAVYLSPDYVDSEDLLANKRTSTALSAGVDGLGVSRVAIINSVRVGPGQFENVPIEIPDKWAHQEPSFIGFPILRRFRLTIDFPNNRLLMAPDPTTSAQPFRKDRAGFGAQRVGNHLEVVYVAEGSPAAAIGLRAGDKIIAVDGKELDQQFFKNYRQSGSRPAGTHIRFTLASGGEKEITLADYY